MNLIDDSKDSLWDVIKAVDMFLLNDEEVSQLTGPSIETAADELLAHGPSVVIIKQGGNVPC